jgi:N-acetylneuraminic acid mutarotase
VGPTFSLSANAGKWQQFSVAWYSGPITFATITILDANVATQGNDFALDDLWFGLDTFNNTGALNVPRYGSTSTLLPNGKVLVAGGDSGSTELASAELYDPATGLWSLTSSMTATRIEHTATLLPTGKVLVAGGGSSELYDPVSGTWTVSGQMNASRSGHTATLMTNGMVLVAGGDVSFQSVLSSAELYNPGTGTWTPTGSMTSARDNHTATLLNNGLVLVAGGAPDDVLSTTTAEVYNPVSGTWTATTSMHDARGEHTATLLPNGKVLVAGGYTFNPPVVYTGPYSLQSAEVYDPNNGTWSWTGSLTTGRRSHTAALLADGKVLVVGGFGHDNYDGLSTAELYDPASGTWSVPGILATARYFHAATLLASGQLLITGGINNQTSYMPANAELYDPTLTLPTGSWAYNVPMNIARAGHTATLLANGNVLVAGGTSFAPAELYFPFDNGWTQTGGMAYWRSNHTATLLLNGKVLAVGGTLGGYYWSSAEVYDPTTGTWVNTNSLHTARELHTATLLPDGRVLVAGGQGYGYPAAAVTLTNTELFDPLAGTWTLGPLLNTAREYHTATLLPSGKVLVAGGYDYNGINAFGSAELYDPAAGTWTLTGSMTTARAGHTATLLPCGKVLVVGGGYGSSVITSAELYDLATATWAATSTLNFGRRYHSATLLPNGQVLVAGGEDANGLPVSSTEVYDPALATWTVTRSLTATREHYTTTLLPNGLVLAAGGGSSELYDVGLGYSSSWQPWIASISSPVTFGAGLTLTGLRFRGISEASCGNNGDSPADYPLVQVRNVGNEQTVFVPSTSWSATALASRPVTGLPPGLAMVTVFANGIPSSSSLVALLRATASVTLGNLAQVYDGTAKSVSVTTVPPGLAVAVTYNGSTSAPANAGSYAVVATITDPSFQGSATGTLVISPGTAVVTLGNLNQTYDGNSKQVSVTTIPAGLAVTVTYNGVMNGWPVYPGNYSVVATVNDANYQGSATGTLVVNKAAARVTLGGLNQTYDGTAKTVTVTTSPAGLAVTVTYNGSTTAPINAGSYAVIATINDPGYQGSASGTLVISPPPVVSTTGSLDVKRFYHTATLLANGKVLVAGGVAISGISIGAVGYPTNGAQLYDPATGQWTPTAPMTTKRYWHTATLLPSGEVLVAGGFDGAGTSAQAELYDPATASWTVTMALHSAREQHTATLLANGMVLVAGGFGGGNTAELFDPVHGTWSTTGSMTTPRYYHTATLLQNGLVLAAGGQASSTVLSSAELYNPLTGAWAPANPMTTVREGQTATLLPNGLVLVAGGGSTPATAEVYNPAGGYWTATSPMVTPRNSHTATLLPNGTVLVAGGNYFLTNTEIFDPTDGKWTATVPLTNGRQNHTATLLPNGRVLFAAGGVFGQDAVPFGTPTAELFDSAHGTWTGTAPMNTARVHQLATVLPNGLVLVAGGVANTTSAEEYDQSNGSWKAVGSMNVAHNNGPTINLLPSGGALVAGGDTSSAEVYSSVAKSWTVTGAMTTRRSYHTTTLLPNGKVLAAGGEFGGYLATAELYDPAGGSWMATTSMNAARYGHAAVLLPSRKVLVAGGYNTTSGTLASAELYDVAAGSWTVTLPMNTPRFLPTLTLLPNGQVLVVGGEDSGGAQLATAELYDPARGLWTATGPLSAPRYGHTATLLPNGQVLVVGDSATVELFDPGRGTWSLTGPLSTARYGLSATLLPSGKVLAAGGYGPLASAELYDVGLGFNASWQPQLATFTSPLPLGTSLTLSGSQFRGIGEASFGTSQDSPADFPVVQLRSIESGQTQFLFSSPGASWSATSFVSAAVNGMPLGWAMVTVFANGIPSAAGILDIVSAGPTIPTKINNASKLSNGSFQLGFANTPGALFDVMATTDVSLPASSWTLLGSATEISPGQFQFTDTQAASFPRRFYRVRSP